MLKSRTSLTTFFLTFLISLWTFPAYAYLDPGTGSLVVQSIIGMIAGGLAVVGLYWGKIKTFFSEKKPEKNKANDPTDKTS